jgi:hypothetical protein
MALSQNRPFSATVPETISASPRPAGAVVLERRLINDDLSSAKCVSFRDITQSRKPQFCRHITEVCVMHRSLCNHWL